jgi:hypothetical protein
VKILNRKVLTHDSRKKNFAWLVAHNVGRPRDRAQPALRPRSGGPRTFASSNVQSAPAYSCPFCEFFRTKSGPLAVHKPTKHAKTEPVPEPGPDREVAFFQLKAWADREFLCQLGQTFQRRRLQGSKTAACRQPGWAPNRIIPDRIMQ